MPLLPKVPNYFKSLFEDTPAVDLPMTSNDKNLIINNVANTAAIHRIGMEILTGSSNKIYLALTASDGSKLGFGQRVGAVTVFSTGDMTGSATQQIDSLRQGVSVRMLNQFDASMIPMIRLTDNPLVNSGMKDQNTFINHRMANSTFGQPKLFEDPIDYQDTNAFHDLLGDVDPVEFIKLGEYYPAYPMIYDMLHYLQPDQLDGVIEVFDIRRTFSNTSIVDLPYMKGVKCELEGGYLNNLKGTATLSSKFEIADLTTEKDYFEDAQETLFASVLVNTSSWIDQESIPSSGSFAIPGFVSTGENINSAFNDAVNYWTGSYGFMPENQLSQLLGLNTTTEGVTGSFRDVSGIGTRFKSATCGLIFGESNALGTDSIAFGGLLK